MKQMLGKFMWGSFPLLVALDTALEDQADIKYTEENIHPFLAKLEEHLSHLIQHISHQNYQVWTGNIPLEEMGTKEFKTKTFNSLSDFV